jgi:FMN phosphatase YigB (HAD superfamily)
VADWKKIKAEYISGGTSYRKLCEKYGVSRTTLQRKAKDEKWLELRSQTEAKTESKIVEAVSDIEAEKAIDIIDVADKLIDKIYELIDDSLKNPQGIKNLTSALKDLKEIKGIKSDADMREQEARIDKLRKDAEREDNSINEIEVVLTAAGPEEWNG